MPQDSFNGAKIKGLKFAQTTLQTYLVDFRKALNEISKVTLSDRGKTTSALTYEEQDTDNKLNKQIKSAQPITQTSTTKNYYSRPSPIDIRFDETSDLASPNLMEIPSEWT